MELDKFLITKDPQGLFVDYSNLEEWCEKWSRPINRNLFDVVNMTEQECSDMLPQIETMNYGGSDLVLSPALEEFILHMTGTNEQGVKGYNDILFKKTVIKDTWVQHGDRAIMTMTPVLDMYFFFGDSKVADAVVTMGVFRAEYEGGMVETGTFQRPVWSRKYDLLADDYLIEYFRYSKLEYMLIQKALYERPEIFRETTKQTVIAPQPTKKKRKGKGRRRTVKAIKVLRVSKDEFADYTKAHKEMTCPCWGVIGHWRNYKSGKRVWISPYRKGKERNNPAAYSAKDYKLEEVQHA